ncbi:MAG: HAD hydrolase-like protein, partial [Lachnospiraceae bacterium]|nr:HAD hydrolase-like protein [Lachnospiraceae bacterium]
IEDALRQLFAGQDDEQGSGQSSGSSNAVSESIRYEELLMIGDRKFDVEGAHALGIRCVGVTYGYAQPGELEEAQADFLAASPDRLLELLLELREMKGGTRHA